MAEFDRLRERTCDYCGKPLDDNFYVVEGYNLKGCTPGHAALLVTSVKPTNWEKWLKRYGGDE